MSRRPVRVAEMIKRELGSLIHQEVRDPRLGFLTIVSVKCADNLRSAKIFVSILGPAKDKDLTISILEKAKGYLSIRVGDLLRLRYAPELYFRLDDSLDKIAELENIFAQIHEPPVDVRPKRGRPRKNPKSD